METSASTWNQSIPAATPRTTGVPRTTVTERFLLTTTITLVPLQDHMPAIGGASIMFLMFGVLTLYVLVNRLSAVDRICTHPVFIAAYAFMAIAAMLETASLPSDYHNLVRFALMICGAVIIASTCRDREALRACLHGYLAAGIWLAIVLFLTSYGVLQSRGATDFHHASQLRSEVFDDAPVRADLNNMAFICLQGGLVGLSLALLSPYGLQRIMYVAMAGFTFVAACLPMSRGGILNAAISAAIVIYRFGFFKRRAIVLVGLLALAVLMLVPSIIWSRLALTAQTDLNGRTEARAELYTIVIEHLPDYGVFGMGAGNYYNRWAYEKGLAGSDVISGAHNTFLQILINWGSIGLLFFLVVIWRAYRCLPRHCDDALTLSLVGIASSSLIYLNLVHTFYDKPFAMALGLLVASSFWVWPGRWTPKAVEP